MQIENMFQKDINRKIKGVITVDKNEDLIYQELDEYVVTNELFKHFTKFFSNYAEGIRNPTVDMGVWISGFFGSGKSHFLKILSYLLDSNLTVKGKKPLDFFKEEEKIKDPVVMGDMENATKVDTDIILFNIDSKSAIKSNSEKDSILNVFVKVFNEMRGYCVDKPYLADFEKRLDEDGKYELFKEEYFSLTNKSWEEKGRSLFGIKKTDFIQTVVNIGYMNYDDAKYWAYHAKNEFTFSIEDFAQEVKDYCTKKGKNHHVVFLVDEVGQYIADDTQLMLNLQTIVEELGMKCHGKAWVIITSQQNIDDIAKDIKGQDLDKIQGRFKTRLSLSSSNVDEVIRRRILAKNDVAQQTLESKYPIIEPILKNIFTFEKSAEMKNYESAKNFADIYPFVPYQFNLVQNVLTSIREHSASGKHMADGERSMLALFQESAIAVKNYEEGHLVPFNIFYDAVDQFIDHTHSQVINKAKDNSFLNDFDVEVLKVLFLVKYVKEIKATSKNITTLMISSIDEDRIELNKKVDKSLLRLLEQTLIQKNGEVYSFLTNEEQDINREIKNQIVDPGEVLDNAANRIFSEIYPKKKYRFSNRYNFQFNQAIDDKKISNKDFDIGMRIITPFYSFNVDDSGQSSFEGTNMHNILKGISESHNEVVVHLLSDLTVFDEIRECLQIQKFLTKKSVDLKPDLRARKQEEYNDKVERIRLFLESSIKDASIYVKGDKVDISEKNVESRLDEAMGKLVDKVYNKLSYMDFAPDKSDIKTALGEEHQTTFISYESKSMNAVNDLENYISDQSNLHNTITLKGLLQRYSKAPYGFSNLDIQWLVATLFSQKRISLTMNSNEITIKEVGIDKIFDYLTKAENFEKLLIGKLVGPGTNEIKTVKSILREVYNLNIQSDDYEVLMDEFKKANKSKLDDVENCLFEFKVSDRYPGKKILEEAKELFNDVNNKKGISQFYQFVRKMEDELLDINKDLESVLAFFNGSQKEIFDNACNVNVIYENNKNFIDDSNISQIASDINKIINMSSPYSNIHRLPELIKTFNSEFDEILEEKRKIIINGIENDLNSILLKLNDVELKEKFEDRVISTFNSLINQLKFEKNIAVINGYITQSDNVKNTFIQEINKFIEENGHDVKPPKVVTVDIINFASSPNINFETEEQIDEFLEKIKNELKNELENADVINLKL